MWDLFLFRESKCSVLRLCTVAVAVLLLGASGGCDGVAGEAPFPNAVPTETLNAGVVDVEQIDRGQYGAIVDGTRRVLRDEEAYASFWEALHADQGSVPDRPPVNFKKEVVVAVVLGQRPTGGYSVEIDDVRANDAGSRIQVAFTETVPGDECAVTQALTSPYVLATVAAQDETFTFEGSEATRSC